MLALNDMNAARKGPNMKTNQLRGCTVLIVEDDYTAAMDLQLSLEEAGATIVGPVGRIDDAIGLVWDLFDIDVAVLDINIRGERVYQVADALRERGIPFVFATGCDRTVVPDSYAQVPLCPKPMEYELLSATLAFELAQRPHGRSH
jgi:CheY-like chemotaxis protein